MVSLSVHAGNFQLDSARATTWSKARYSLLKFRGPQTPIVDDFSSALRRLVPSALFLLLLSKIYRFTKRTDMKSVNYFMWK